MAAADRLVGRVRIGLGLDTSLGRAAGSKAELAIAQYASTAAI